MSSQQGHGCGGGGGQDFEQAANAQKLANRMALVKHKVLVLSGKGGVGKSTVAVNLAFALAAQGKSVGLLDIDIHGPSVPVMLGLEGERLIPMGDGFMPVPCAGVAVMSIGFMLKNNDDALIWRGPMKMGVIEQFLREVEWGELDYLVVDAPPGTGDEPLSIAQLLPGAHAVIVTTPQKVATADVRKSISFCRKLELPILGVVENMNGLICPKCGEHITVFPQGEAEKMAREMKVPFLVSLPMDPRIALGADQGKTLAALDMEGASRLLGPLIDAALAIEKDIPPLTNETETSMRIAIPTADGRLCNHFGHCEQFAILDVDPTTKAITATQLLTPPPHEPGVIPRWVAEQKAKLVLAGGMGGRAIDLFNQAGVEVICGCPAIEPEKLVEAYFAGTLTTGTNACNHDEKDHTCGGH